MINILLTGSGGFVGGNLKDFLRTKYNLLTPRSYELNCINNEEVNKYFNENCIDFVIHCGSVGGYRGLSDKDTTIEDNLAMVENILTFKRKETRVILFGSGAMYDRKRELHKVKEEEIGKFEPTELYGKSKMLIAQKIENRDDVLCLNIFGCYGKNEKSSRFPSYVISQNLAHKPIEINQNVVFDYLYIDDLCIIIEYFITHKPQNNILNLTPSESISLEEMAKLVNFIGEYSSEIIIKEQKMNYEYTGDNTKLLRELGGFEFTSYKDGITELYKEIKNSLFQLR